MSRASAAWSRRAAAQAGRTGPRPTRGGCSAEARGCGAPGSRACVGPRGRRVQGGGRRRRQRRAGLVGTARPERSDPRRLPGLAEPRAASPPRRLPAPSRSRPSLPSWRNMAAAAASASQDELSKCRRQPAAAGRNQRCAGPGPAAGAQSEGRARCRRGAPGRVGGGVRGVRALGPGVRAGRGTLPPAFVGLRFAPSRCEIETGAPGGATSARDPPRPGCGGAQPPLRGAWTGSPGPIPGTARPV